MNSAYLWVGGNMHGDVETVQDAMVECDKLLIRKPCRKI